MFIFDYIMALIFPTPFFIAPVLAPYVAKFEKDFNIKVDMFIDTTKNENTTAGMCYWGLPGRRKILIKESTLKDYPLVVTEVLMYHELGHCVFDLPHSKDPSNIMYPYINDALCLRYITDKQSILKQLK